MRNFYFENIDKNLICCPKPLRKRFSGLKGIFIERDGSQAYEYDHRTGALVHLPEIFTDHFKKCVEEEHYYVVGETDGLGQIRWYEVCKMTEREARVEEENLKSEIYRAGGYDDAPSCRSNDEFLDGPYSSYEEAERLYN
jgi:hypothetical protein